CGTGRGRNHLSTLMTSERIARDRYNQSREIRTYEQPLGLHRRQQKRPLTLTSINKESTGAPNEYGRVID
ncbi:hypothetical protein, partial [Burkholderia cenocepacia]|uniref:hypothetical protein n=1 Tax=Burkholderia cenocepacia TaxID=95486 RepID=UPI002AB15281